MSEQLYRLRFLKTAAHVRIWQRSSDPICGRAGLGRECIVSVDREELCSSAQEKSRVADPARQFKWRDLRLGSCATHIEVIPFRYGDRALIASMIQG